MGKSNPVISLYDYSVISQSLMLQTARRTLGRLSQGYVVWMGPLEKLPHPTTETIHKPGRDEDGMRLQARGDDSEVLPFKRLQFSFSGLPRAHHPASPVSPVWFLSPAQVQAGFLSSKAPPC